MNTNCLAKMRCPDCGNYGPFRILASVWVDVLDEGTEDCDGFEWEDDSPCECRNCDYTATVGDFKR